MKSFIGNQLQVVKLTFDEDFTELVIEVTPVSADESTTIEIAWIKICQEGLKKVICLLTQLSRVEE